ncbi:hypothetical protein LY76DRAFT_36431 [Colletotrichum caudatum]|nr:hypothetical protein LY76DRAFT_36431 [Colletotrichum caudatum]
MDDALSITKVWAMKHPASGIYPPTRHQGGNTSRGVTLRIMVTCFQSVIKTNCPLRLPAFEVFREKKEGRAGYAVGPPGPIGDRIVDEDNKSIGEHSFFLVRSSWFTSRKQSCYAWPRGYIHAQAVFGALHWKLQTERRSMAAVLHTLLPSACLVWQKDAIYQQEEETLVFRDAGGVDGLCC